MREIELLEIDEDAACRECGCELTGIEQNSTTPHMCV